MDDMIEVVIDSIRVSLTSQQRIVVLREINRERFLPIWIGPFEAEAITIGLQEIEIARPQTHDLLRNLIQEFGYELRWIEVNQMREDIFYANLVLAAPDSDDLHRIDCRPSDALSLVSRVRVPIYVAREIFDRAGIEPEIDLESSRQASLDEIEEAEFHDDDERLSVFENFLSHIDLNSDQEDEEDEDSSDLSNSPPDED